MSTQNVLSASTIEELAMQAHQIISYSLANGIKPMVAIVVHHHDGQWLGAFMCLYAGETKTDVNDKPVIPLTPFFYPYEVATALVNRGILTEQHESQKTGIQVHWCSVNNGNLSL